MSTRRTVLKGMLATIATSASACGGDSELGKDAEPVQDILELSLSDYPELAATGGWLRHSVTATFILLVARPEADTFIALDALCTHQQCVLSYDVDERQLECRCHGSTFTETGLVTMGPAERPLSQYATSFDGDIVTIELAADAPS